MTEEDAQRWIIAQGWGGTTFDRLAAFVALVRSENQQQNLVAVSTEPTIWARHIVDSLQLILLAGDAAMADALWVDLGSGAGFPGLAVACVRPRPTLLIEVRPLRARFLQSTVDALGLTHVQIHCGKVEQATDVKADIVSARAFAPCDRLFDLAGGLADQSTLWLWPKGRQAEKELASAQTRWQGMFHVEHSVTDQDSKIIVARNVALRNQTGTRRARPAHRTKRGQA